MMGDIYSIIFVIFLSILGLCVLGFSIGSFLNDKKIFQIEKQKSIHPFSRSLKSRPLISVVVFVWNDQDSIINLIENVFDSSYKNLELIIANNASVDGTIETIREFQKQHPKKLIKIYTSRHIRSSSLTIQRAITAYSKAEYILEVPISARLEKYTVLNSLQTFKFIDQDILVTSMREKNQLSVISFTRQLSSIFQSYMKKTTYNLNLESPRQNAVILYAREKLKFISSPKIKPTTFFASNIVANVEPTLERKIHKSLRRLDSKWYLYALLSWTQSFLWLFVSVYSIYYAIILKQPQFYVIIWIVFSIIAGILLFASNVPRRFLVASILPLVFNFSIIIGAYILIRNFYYFLSELLIKLLNLTKRLATT